MEIETTQGIDPAEAATPASDDAVESAPTTVAAEPAADDAGAELSKVQKRIDRLTWERSEKEREAEYWRNLALSRQQPEQPKAPERSQAPTLAQFDGDEAQFHDAWVKYNQSLIKEGVSAHFAEQQQQERKSSKVGDFKKREADFIAKTPDYQEKVYDPAKTYFTDAVAELIADSDDGPAVAYYLADNPDIGMQIARLPQLAAAREIGKIEARLTAKPPVTPVSKAPAPPPRIEAVEPDIAIKASDPASDKLTTKQWVKAYQREHRKKG